MPTVQRTSHGHYCIECQQVINHADLPAHNAANPTHHSTQVRTTTQGAEVTFDVLPKAMPIEYSSNVTVTPTDGHTLIYNATSGQWESTLLTVNNSTGSRAVQRYMGNIPAVSGTQLIDVTLAPTIADGVEIWNQTMDTSTDTSQVALSTSIAFATSNASAAFVVVIFRGTTPIGAMMDTAANRGSLQTVTFSLVDTPGLTGTYTYSARVASTAGSWYVNQGDDPAVLLLGGFLESNGYAVEEVVF